MAETGTEWIEVGAGAAARRIAVLLDGPEQADGPALLWCGGFASDMSGSKAAALAAWGRANGRRVVRFDYSGHGQSGGTFADGTIGAWLEEAEAVARRFAPGPLVIVGSSMGGWMALLLALRLGCGEGRVEGLVLVAPAPDFTELLIWERMTPEMRQTVIAEGRLDRPSAYGPPIPITRRLIEEGRQHLLLGRPIGISGPVHILQGRLDVDVPPEHALRLAACLPHADLTLTFVDDGDHRLSRPDDIDRMLGAVATVAGADPG